MSSPIGQKRKIDEIEKVELSPQKQPHQEVPCVTIRLSNDRVIALSQEQKTNLINQSRFFKSTFERGFLEQNGKLDLTRTNCDIIDHIGDKDAVEKFILMLSKSIEISSLETAVNFLNISKFIRDFFETETLDQQAKVYVLANGYMKDLSKVLKLYDNNLTVEETKIVMKRVMLANQNRNDLPNEDKLINILSIGLESESLSKAMRWIMNRFKNIDHINLNYELRYVKKAWLKNILDRLPNVKSIKFINKKHKLDKNDCGDGWEETRSGIGFLKILKVLKNYPLIERLSFNHVETFVGDFRDFHHLQVLEFHGDYEDFYPEGEERTNFAVGQNVKKVVVDSRFSNKYYGYIYERKSLDEEKPFQLIKKGEMEFQPSGVKKNIWELGK